MADKTFSRIILNGETLMDVRDDTVEASTLLSPKTATDSYGQQITGIISTKTSSDVTASGKTVTVPSGYYSSQVAKSVDTMTLPTTTATTSSGTNKATIDRSTSTRYINIPTGYNETAANYKISAVANGSATTPTTTITATNTVSINTSGVISSTVSGSSSITPTVSAGYVSSGTAGTVSVTGSSSLSLTTQATAIITPSATSQTAVASQRYTTGAVTVAAVPTESATLTSNGAHTASNNKWWKSVTVQVPSDLNLQSNKNATPSTSQVIVTPDTGYNGLAQVTVASMTSGTAGTPVATKGTVSNNQISITPSVTNTTGYITGGTKSGTAATVSASELVSGNFVVTGAGNNQNVVNYAYINVPSGSAYVQSSLFGITPTIAVSSSGQISVSGSSSVSVTPTVSAGWISTGSAGEVVGSVSGTSQLTTASATTITPSTQAITAVASQRYTLGAITVAGDTDLVASNIKKDVNIFGVTGTYEGSGGGTVAPVGTVICMSTNTNPSTDLGGTWELIEKKFTHWNINQANLSDAKRFFIPNDTNFTLSSALLYRADNTFTIRIVGTNKVALDDTTVALGNFVPNNMGLSSWAFGLYVEGSTDSGNGIIQFEISNAENPVLQSLDSVTKTSGGSVAANNTIHLTFTFIVPTSYMLDSECDRFYFEKTSNTDYTVKTGAKTVTANGTYNPSDDNLDYYSQVTVQRGTSEPGYLNVNGELVATFTYDKWAVADESLSINTYSTSTSTLKASAASYGTYAADTANYNYTVVQDVLVYPVYTNSAPATAAGKFRGQMFHVVNDYCNYRSGFAVVDGTSSTAITTTATISQYRLIYNSGATTLPAAAVSAYGYYMIPTAATFGSTISVTRPSLLQRGSTTYCTSAFVAAVSDVRYQWIAKIYRTPKDVRPTGGMMYSGMQHIADAFNSGSRNLT